MTPPLDNLIIAQKLSGQYLRAFGGQSIVGYLYPGSHLVGQGFLFN
ncbi:hypothetical protein ES705_16570 [subsurface metagenome]|jgi:hypothetical protein